MSTKVAFVGDTGVETTGSFGFYAKAVMDMLHAQGVELIIQNGDLDYEENPKKWNDFLKEYVYDRDMDILVSSGNHEEEEKYGSLWYGVEGYKELMKENLKFSTKFKNCVGEYGETFTCESGESLFIMIGWKQTSSKKELEKSYNFIKNSLLRTNKKIKFCVWHQPEGKLNPGDDELDNFEMQYLYEACRESAAIVMSGHSHVYGRTKLISSFLPDDEDPDDNPSPEVSKDDEFNPSLDCGETISIISGMGGFKFDGEGKYAGKDRFRTVLTSKDIDDSAGALICDIPDEIEDKDVQFRCEFRLSTNVIIEEFIVEIDSKTFGNRCLTDDANRMKRPRGPVLCNYLFC